MIGHVKNWCHVQAVTQSSFGINVSEDNNRAADFEMKVGNWQT